MKKSDSSAIPRIVTFYNLLLTIFVTFQASAVTFRANEPLESDYGLQKRLPGEFGAGEFTLEVRVRLDESFPVGLTGPHGIPEQVRNWSLADPEPYSSEDWWYQGNFLLDGHNNNDGRFWEGTFSVQLYGAGRVRWLFGDGEIKDPGGCRGVQAYPSISTPSLLDDQWHWISVVRRWPQNADGADLELWVDGKKIATERTNVRTNMRKYWGRFDGFREHEEGWFWGTEKQAAVGYLDQYEDFKGELSDIRFWSIARSPQELAFPEREVTKGAVGLVGLYTLPERFGGKVCNALTGGECIQMLISDRRWKFGRPQFGFADWAVLAALVWATAMAANSMRRHGANAPVGRVWAGVTVVLAVLALVMWLDLEVLLERYLRQTARNQGWYRLRRAPQMAGVIAVSAAAYYGFYATIRSAGRLDRATRAAVGLCSALLVIAVVRTSSWTYTDSVLEFMLGPVNVGRVLEFIGACAVSVAAIRSTRQRQNP